MKPEFFLTTSDPSGTTSKRIANAAAESFESTWPERGGGHVLLLPIPPTPKSGVESAGIGKGISFRMLYGSFVQFRFSARRASG